MKKIAVSLVLASLLALGAWNKHGTSSPPGYDYTVNFNSLSAGTRWTLSTIQSTFNDPSIVAWNTNDTSTYPLYTIVDASSYPGSHQKALQGLYPYGSLGIGVYSGCPTACPITGYGPQNSWDISPGDTPTVNLEFDMLFVPGFDFRYIGGKTGPSIITGTGGWSGAEQAGIKIIWRASDDTLACPRNSFPTTGSCYTGLQVYYFAYNGNPLVQYNPGWQVSTGSWHHFKEQFHRGCPIDKADCVDHAYINVWGPTSDSDNTQVLWLSYSPHVGDGNEDTSTGYTWDIICNEWFGGGVPDNACAAGSLTAGSGCTILYDNIRIWSGTGP